MIKLDLKLCPQKTDSACCGPCCIKMVADYYGIEGTTKASLIKLCKVSKEKGTTFPAMKKAIKKLGMSYRLVTGEPFINSLIDEKPCIVCVPEPWPNGEYGEEHYVVISGVDHTKRKVYIADPYRGHIVIDGMEFYRKYFGELLWCLEVGYESIP